MAYKALYRSYRPAKFNEVVGQKPIIKTLQNALKENKISHAYIFSGSRGIGKTTIARILAKAANCEQLENGEPCNHCKNCLAVNNDSTTDIIELDAASNNGVDEIRNLLEKVNFLPSTLNKKVYIIDEAHMLTTSSFNALLKTLEEPPSYVIFILATTEPQKLPLTILSRCQRFNFKPLTITEIKERLRCVTEKENIEVTDEALISIAEAAEGGMRDALGILDQVSVYSDNKIEITDVENVTGKVSFYKSVEILNALRNRDASSALFSLNELIDMGKDVNNILTSITQLCRDALLYKTTDDVEFYKYVFDIKEFQEFTQNIEVSELFYYIDVLVDIQNKIKYSNSPKIFLEIGLMKIASRANEDINIIERLNNLENKVNNGEFVSGSNYDQTSYPQADNRLNLIEGKIKKLSNDIEKMDVKGFKETTLSKFNVLEDAAAFVSTLPRDIISRIIVLEETVNELKDELVLFKNIIASQTENEKERDLSLSNNEFEQRIVVIEQKLNDITKQLVDTNNSEEVKEVRIETDDENEDRLNDLEKRISNLELTQNEVKDIDNEQRLQQFDTRIQTLENNNEVTTGSTSDNEKISNLEKRIEVLEERKPAINQTLPLEDTTIQELKERMQSLEEYNDLVINRVDELSVLLDGLKKLGMEVNKDSLYDQNKYLDTIKEVEELKENFLILINKVQELQNQLGQTTLPISDNVETEALPLVSQQELDEINDKLSVLNDSIEQVKQNIPSIINSKIALLEDIYAKKDALNNTNEKLDNIKIVDYQEEINKLQDYVDTVKEYSYKLNIKVSELETEFGKFKAKKEIKETPTVVKEENQNKEPDIKKEETPVVVKEEPKVEPTPTSLPTEEDVSNKIYDVRIIERILHQARDQKCREEKAVILTKWGNLENNVGHLLSNVARLLTNGKLVANGNNELLIIYPNATLCNHLMEEKIHLQAKQVLRITFGKEYDFIALPENVWQDKRLEYHSQYSMGIVYPKLTPIKDPNLRVIVTRNTTQIPVKKTLMEEASNLFGADVVEKEEEDK